MARRKREIEQRKTICYVATHNDSGRCYVGITKRGLKARRSQHERNAKNKPFNGPFHDALRKYGKNAFTWEVVAEGEDGVIRLLEHALIERLGTNQLGGFNAVGGYALPPIRDLEFDRGFEEHQRDARFLDMLNDLDSIVRYCEENYSGSIRLKHLRELGTRLLKRVDELDDV